MDKQTGDQNKRLSERLASARIEGARKSRATELYLSGQSLTHFPEETGQLTQLQRLNLAYNELTAVPEMLRQLTQLQRLDLSALIMASATW